ncbi:unnamed protein product, partial [Iphiclides podalirius]
MRRAVPAWPFEREPSRSMRLLRIHWRYPKQRRPQLNWSAIKYKLATTPSPPGLQGLDTEKKALLIRDNAQRNNRLNIIKWKKKQI